VASAVLRHRRSAARPPLAGVDLGSTAVRVALVTAEEGRARIAATERTAIRPGWVVRGVVRDAPAVAEALRDALARAESDAGEGAAYLVVALGGDDLRTQHATARAVRPAQLALRQTDIERTARDAARRATQGAASVFADEPGLRGIALQPLEAVATSATLDGRAVDAARGQRGGIIDVGAVAAVLPVVHTSTAEIALKAIGRAARFVAAPVALAALLAEAGVGEALVVDGGADLTGVAVIHGGALVGARSLSLSLTALERRPRGERRDDLATWARCVVVAARAVVGEGPLPPRVLVSGDVAEVDGVRAALSAAVISDRTEAEVTVEPLRPELLSTVVEGHSFDPEYLVAVGAARTGQRR
jgi:hypothetical protein